MSIADTFIEKAKSSVQRLVFPEACDPRILRAVRRLKDESICELILVGNAEKISQTADPEGISLAGIVIEEPVAGDRLNRYAKAYAQRRQLAVRASLRLVRKPLAFGACMVAAADADGMVAGACSTTAKVLSIAELCIGHAEGVSTLSSIFVMEIPKCLGKQDKVLVFADCALNTDPTAEELADIAVSSAQTARSLLGIEPCVAMLSFSTMGSASHESVEKVRRAVAIARGCSPSLVIEGELQADAALVARVAARKVPDSEIAGRANVLIFPDLNSANISYKLTQCLANAGAYGPVLQGFAAPVNDLSRGATEEDIVVVAAITAIQSQARP